MLLGILVLLAVAAAVSVLTRHDSWLDLAIARTMAPVAWLLEAAAAVLATLTGALGIAGHVQTLRLGTLAGLGSAELRVDRLSGLFVVICFAVAVPVLLAGAARDAAHRPRLPAAIAMTLAAVLVILTADHLFVLLFGWESLTFAFYLLSGFDRHAPHRPRASVAAVMFGKVSGAALLAGGLVLAARSHSFLLTDLGGGAHGAAWQAGYGLLLLGFAAKVGLVPLQVWLAPAYAAAPGPARAVMAGVAVNVGFYGMWRTVQVLGPAPVWLASVVLVIAGITAILGIAHAAVHPDLAQLIAWSSVENAGVITAGFGAALVGSAAHNPQLQAAGLLAGTAQVIAHALGKALLFTAASAIEADTGTTELDALRALTRRMPWAGTGLIIGSLTLAGLPLTAGFASEWFTLESLMQQFRVSQLSMQLASATAGALVALTVGVAGVTFVRLIGLTAFGAPPTEPRTTTADRAVGHRCAIAALSISCLGVAAVAPLEVRMIAVGLQPVSGQATRGALKSPWVLQPVFAEFSALSPTWLWLAIPALTAIIAIVATLFSGSRLWHVRRVPAWSSASPGVDRGVGYTSFGWANPMRKVLANLLLTRSQLRDAERGDQVLAPDPDPAESGLPGFARPTPPALQYRVDIVEVVGRYLYQPLGVALFAIVHAAKRLQSGRLDAYLGYMLIALVAVLAVVAALA
jgi:formate hydrogenlyase subunit 3/multisubunit Na+/H+ antiporter MnhD subunit